MNNNGKGLEKSHREGITITELIKMFPDDEAAKWFEKNIWGDKPKCPRCGNTNITKTNHHSMPYYCAGLGACHKRFSVKFGTVMEHSRIVSELSDYHVSVHDQHQGYQFNETTET